MDQYLKYVQEVAESLGKIFMLDTGEGNDFADEATGWYIEDLSGWLIEPSAKTDFLDARDADAHYKSFSPSYVLVKWRKTENGSIDIEFQPYQSFSV